MKLGNSSRAMGVGAYFLKAFLGWRLDAASWSLLVRAGKLTRWDDVDNQQLVSRGVARSQVAIFNVCYEWRICSVWQVARERMNGCSYVIERTMQSSPLLREGGLRNDAAGAALWRTRPECVRDRCVSIIDYCYRWRVSGIEFSSLVFATNGGFVRLKMLLTEWKHLSVRRHMNSCSYIRTRLTNLTSCDMC